ncbi:MAG: type I methionyl aminopeptidase [Bacilli bacterium]|jgi:methionyl aminopeptidase|nr:type I methionyl aminopeptidase [Bacilli bacterium]
MIIIKSEREIELMKEAGLMVSKTHKYLKPFIKAGITTKELDDLAFDYIKSLGGNAACKGYGGFPGAICISVNEEVVHGIGGKRVLKNGDIVTLDIVVEYKGYHGDSAWTYEVGEISEENKYLLKHTENALYEGLKMVKPGARLGDVSYAIMKYAEKYNLGVVRELTGHGIGNEMHEAPDIPNYGKPHTGPILKEGMCLAIEPMLNLGTRDIYILDDDWTIVTQDGKNSAHFEHTVVVTKDGCYITTPRLN